VKTADLRLDHYNQDGNQFARGAAGFNNNGDGERLATMLGYLGMVICVGSGRGEAHRVQPVLLHQRHMET
jgi:hypothetical protein